jgi:hypothetical protein
MTNGKGSKPRPLSVSQETFANNWDAIFGPKDKSVPTDLQHTDTQTQPKKKRKSNE